jgi:SSS family solute:Na+ symporter
LKDLVTSTGAAATSAGVDAGAGVLSKFSTLNETAMHMDTPAMPWPILLLGIWIPNFYYWGLNQYISQRILGSASLGEGQKGLMLAAGLKLIIPFIIVIPGIIAFNLFSTDMEKAANEDAGGSVFSIYEKAVANKESKTIFTLDEKYANTHIAKAKEIEAYNKTVMARLGKGEKAEKASINPYKYDSAMGLLITKLIPKNKGVLGFVIAALLGAIISSLAAVLNAASTLFTMDVYQRYIRPKAKQFEFVTFGRFCIGVFVVIGCVVAPLLDQFKSIFGFIQAFQGYVSTGILAVFVYGLLNRTSGKWAGVLGIVSNAVIYQFMMTVYPDMHFLYSMSICLIVVLSILCAYGLIWKAPVAVTFESNTTLDMTPSKGAMIWGAVITAATVALYVIFW